MSVSGRMPCCRPKFLSAYSIRVYRYVDAATLGRFVDMGGKAFRREN